MSERGLSRRRARALAGRWLGVGLAAAVSVVTLGLAATDRLTLYISPETVWFASAAAVLTLVGAIWSCTVPLGVEGHDGHDHDHDHGHGHDTADAADGRGVSTPARRLARVGAVSGGVLATVVVGAALVVPPASLSVELAMSRVPAQGALFAGADTPALGAVDTDSFGVGEWAQVFATATRPETYDGTAVTLTGFVTPGGAAGEVQLTRLIITHCVIDAQPAAVALASADAFPVGQWLEVTGTVRAAADGSLSVVPTRIEQIAEPRDPYEY